MFPKISPGQGVLANFFAPSGGMDEQIIAGVYAHVRDFPSIFVVKKYQIPLL